MSEPQSPLVEFRSVTKEWSGRAVLRGANLSIARGQHTLIQGESGSGKTTAIRLIARLVTPDSGDIRLSGAPVSAMGSRAHYRRTNLGIILQEPRLIDTLTVFHIFELVSSISRSSVDTSDTWLDRLGLRPLRGALVGHLSRGERQRLAVGLALVGQPRVLLADEPTASLDPPTARDLLDLMFSCADAHQTTVLMVSHDPAAAQHTGFQQHLVLRDGAFVVNKGGTQPSPVG